MPEYVMNAIDYVKGYKHMVGSEYRNLKELKNDAANIYADNYGQYLTIWSCLCKEFPDD